MRNEAIGYWWAAVPKDNWPEDEDLLARIDKTWHRLWGDRRQELVFIGTRDMDKAALTAALDACLLELPAEGKASKQRAGRRCPIPSPSGAATPPKFVPSPRLRGEG